MKKRKKSGGKRAGAGRCYNPWKRIALAERFAELKSNLRQAGWPNAAQIALDLLHAEEHPNGGGSIETTRRLVVQGRHDDIFICEVSAKRDNREPLSDFEQSVLRKIARRNMRLLRRLLRPR